MPVRRGGVRDRPRARRHALARVLRRAASPRSCAATPDTLTISAGIAVARHDETAIEKLVARADQGLYAAKAAGRARVAWFAADSNEELVVSEPIHVARPAAFEVLDGGEASAPLSVDRRPAA